MDERTMQPPDQPQEPAAFDTGKRELVFAAFMLLFSWGLCNSFLYGGTNLGFGICAAGCILCSFLYLLCSGYRPTPYSTALLVLCIAICAGFARTDDGFVKFVMTCFLVVSTNLSFCLLSGKNQHRPGSVLSLLDAPRAVFALGLGHTTEAFQGLLQAFHRSGSAGKKGGAFLVGLCIAVPLLAMVIPLLIQADAAFDGLMALLPEFDGEEFFSTVIFGTGLACALYLRGVGLHHARTDSREKPPAKGVNAITVNTVLGAIGLVYGVYLLSQLAYLSGGFAGILPQGYTLAQYARRGFFEMAILSGGNLTLIIFCLGLVRKKEAAPLSTRLLCLFFGIVTLFFIATASAKMFLYIDSYGLTRLRVLTQIIMLFLAVTTLVVMLWLFIPKLRYMQVVLLAAMVIGTATLWIDVDTQVARYNVDAYLSGQLEQIDVSYLSSLGDGSIPHLARLAQQATDPQIAQYARSYLTHRTATDSHIRGWNYASHIARQYLPDQE